MEKYSVNGWIAADSKNREELLGYLLDAAKHMEQVDNCYIYSVGIDPADSEKVYIYEVWQSEAAHKNSLGLDVFRNLINQAKPIIKEMDDYPTLIIKGGKGV